MRISECRVNHMTAPLGVDRAPEFSWRMESETQNVFQTAFQITVSDAAGLVWDSGKRSSDVQSFVPYGGELKSRTHYTVTVTVWDNQGNTAQAESEFETAFLFQTECQGRWIESPIQRNEAKLFTYGIENPVLLFERSFPTQKEIASARLYAACYGCYRVYLNGQRPDEREFAPEFTPYGSILNYQTYDVTALLQAENALAFEVGDGWFFCAQTAVKTPEEHCAPAILYQLEVRYADGETALICSDGSETVRTTNILFSDLFMGERQDRTLPYGEKHPVLLRDYDLSVLRAQPQPPILPIELIPAKEVYTSPRGETIVDFGQVIAGRARIWIDAPAGAELSFEYTEVVDREKNYFSTMSLRQCDTVVSDGTPFLHEAHFTFHGFRYIRVSGMMDPRPEDFTAVLLSTVKENAGSFSCDDERLNRLYQNIRYSQKNNMLSIPTDCPTREKAGWTGDILIYAETAMLNEEMTPFLSSWLSGLLADQRPDGVIPLVSPLTNLYEAVAIRNMAPFGDTGMTGIAGWSDAVLWVPYEMYRSSGNLEVLRRCYPAMKQWCGYILQTAQEKRGSDLPEDIDRWLWNTGFHFGEWLVPGRESEGFEICKESACYIAPYFGYETIRRMAEVCCLIGEDPHPWRDAAEHMKDAIVKGIFRQGLLPDYLMGAYVLAFAFDLVPDDLHDEYAGRLIALVEKGNCTIGTGFLATPYLLPVLDKLGRHDLSLKILFNERQPSWLYEVKLGATAIWENWLAMGEDGQPIKTSFDHYAFGCVDSYLFHTICGIKGDPGYRHFTIEPDASAPLRSFRRSFICESGRLCVELKDQVLSVTIPCNTEATVRWRGEEHHCGSGQYSF